MILSDTEIRAAIEQRLIVIEPFDPEALGSNSYDVHLGRTLAVYEDEILDAKKHNRVRSFEIPDDVDNEDQSDEVIERLENKYKIGNRRAKQNRFRLDLCERLYSLGIHATTDDSFIHT